MAVIFRVLLRMDHTNYLLRGWRESLARDVARSGEKAQAYSMVFEKQMLAWDPSNGQRSGAGSPQHHRPGQRPPADPQQWEAVLRGEEILTSGVGTPRAGSPLYLISPVQTSGTLCEFLSGIFSRLLFPAGPTRFLLLPQCGNDTLNDSNRNEEQPDP